MPRKTKTYENATDAAVAYISIKRRTCNEVREKLRELGFNLQQTEETIEILKDSLLLDDNEYITDYISSCRATRPMSKRAIKAKLLRHKLPKELVEAEFESMDDEQEYESARVEAYNFLSNALAKPHDAKKLREKLYRRLAGKGYTYDVIKTAMQSAYDSLGEDEKDDGNYYE